MSKEKERRLFRRHGKELKVQYSDNVQGYDFLGNKTGAGTSVNISAGGLCLKTSEDLQTGGLLRLSFLIPNTLAMASGENDYSYLSNSNNGDSEPVFRLKYFEGVGKIVRIDANGGYANHICVKFINIDPEICDELNAYLEK